MGQGDPTLLTTVSQLDPMRVTFPISEAQYMRVASRAAALETLDPLDAGTDRQVLELLLADGSVYPHKGWFVSVGREVEKGTGTLLVQAVFPNPERILRPGQYGRVQVPRPTEGKPTVVVPESAVKELQGSYTVAVVTPEDTVQIRAVEVGPRAEQALGHHQGRERRGQGHHRRCTEGVGRPEGRRPAGPLAAAGKQPAAPAADAGG